MVVIMQNTSEKVDLQETKANDTKTKRVHADGNKLVLGKNKGSQADEILAVYKLF